MLAVRINEFSQAYSLTLEGEAVAHTSHKELANAMQRAATSAVDVAQARSSALLAALEGVPAPGMPRVAVHTNGTDQVELSFTATAGGVTQPLQALPGVDLNNRPAVVDGVLPVLQQRGTVLEIEGEVIAVFFPEGSATARAVRVEDGHLWVESGVSGYWEHASLADA